MTASPTARCSCSGAGDCAYCKKSVRDSDEEEVRFYPIVTLQYSSTTLHQVSHYIQ